jgi:integrase
VRVKFTDAVLAALPTDAGPWISDQEVEGFRLFINPPRTGNPAGKRVFVFRYDRRIAGRTQQYQIPIGQFRMKLPSGEVVGTTTVAQARRDAMEYRRQVDAGLNPAADIKAKAEAEAARLEAERRETDAPDVDAMMQLSIAEREAEGRAPDYIADLKRMHRMYIQPALGTVKVADVTQDDVKRLHASIRPKRGRLGGEDRARTVVVILKAGFNTAIARAKIKPTDSRPNPYHGIIRDNPCDGVEVAPGKIRTRYVDPDVELPAFFDALESFKDRDGVRAIELSLETGARRGEVLKATWPMFDLRLGTWTKPLGILKQRRTRQEHVVHLSKRAYRLLKQMRDDADRGLERAAEFERLAPPPKANPKLREAMLNKARLARAQYENRDSGYLFPRIKPPRRRKDGSMSPGHFGKCPCAVEGHSRVCQSEGRPLPRSSSHPRELPAHARPGPADGWACTRPFASGDDAAL